MLVSESAKFVFLHNPKAGGTTVRNALLPWDTRNNHFWGITHDPLTNWNVDKAHLPLHVLARLYPKVRALIDTYVTFGFSRHPLSRFVSAFNESFPALYKQHSTGTLSLDEYAGRLNAYAAQLTAGGEWNPNFTHATPQKPIFYDGNKCAADLIIPIEAPLPRVLALKTLLGAPGAAVAACFAENATQKNVRRQSLDPSELLTPVSLSALCDFYSNDFEFFGYQAETSNSPSLS